MTAGGAHGAATRAAEAADAAAPDTPGPSYTVCEENDEQVETYKQ